MISFRTIYIISRAFFALLVAAFLLQAIPANILYPSKEKTACITCNTNDADTEEKEGLKKSEDETDLVVFEAGAVPISAGAAPFSVIRNQLYCSFVGDVPVPPPDRIS